MIWVRITARMWSHNNLRPELVNQRRQIGNQIVPVWQAILIRRQDTAIPATDATNIRFIGNAGGKSHGGIVLHGR